MVEVKKIDFLGWKDCLLLTNGSVKVVVTTAVGPRIISLTINNKAEHMTIFEESKGKSGGDGFVAYGGHRVWHAPEESVRTYFPDNEPCVYEIKGNTVSVMHKEKETGLTKGVVIEMEESGSITVNNVIANDGFFDVELSVWGLTQLDPNGMLVIPNSRLDTGLVGNRAVSMWPYSKMNDKRVYWGDKFICVTPDTKAVSPFKLGSTVDEGYAAYFNHGQLLLKEFEHYYNADYPNYFCNFETYTNKDMIEFESLSPIMTVEPGEVAVSVEKWHFADDIKKPGALDEDAIEKAVKSVLDKVRKDGE